ncbi:MAG: hypothetical protein E7645_02875 [Ruminococcaceae bacterium]|nr:hypothetical protein [Oscillospiraceae bacterium]
MKKKFIIIAIVSVILLLCITVGLIIALCSRPPELELVYDRLVELIEKSHEVNVVMFGAGLPVYPRGTEEDELLHRYYGFYQDGREFITPYAKFSNIASIKEAASQVYSSEYCDSLFESLFTGYAPDVSTGSILPARYSEDDMRMYQNSYVKPIISGTRVYDYASMEIVFPSRGNYIIVEIDSYAENDPDNWVTVDLTFVYENGNWYLDGPSC